MLMVNLKGRPVAIILVQGQDYEAHHVVQLIETANLSPGLTIAGDKHKMMSNFVSGSLR